MKEYEVKPLDVAPDIEVTVPGSKSITNRALLLAALAGGTSTLRGVLLSEDARHFLDCLLKLGFSLTLDEKEKVVTVQGEGGHIPKKKATIYVGSAGTAARFLTALAGLSDGEYTVDASEQMRKRPMRELLQALEQLGARIEYLGEAYALPIHIVGAALAAPDHVVSQIELDIDRSSQFLSALLITSTLLKRELTIKLTGKRKARSYVIITERMMKEFGHQGVTQLEEDCYRITQSAPYKAREYQVEPDVSAACYFYAMAALTGGRVKVRHVTGDSLQGDIRFLDVLESMGCYKEREESREIVLCGEKVSGEHAVGKLQGITVDMSDFSDQTMTLAALAPFADSPVTIQGVAHIRGQESDRLHAIVTELTERGIVCEEREDGVKIMPGIPSMGLVHTYEDHRMAMAFALMGLRVSGIRIENPDCCAKTFAEYFSILDDITKNTL